MTNKSRIPRAVVRRLCAPALAPLAFGFVLLAVLLSAGNAAAQSAATANPPSTLAVTDEAFRVVRVPQPVRRIVSLAPNLTETVFALGLGDLLVGDTDYCNYPAEALKKAHVGGPVNPSLEEMMALHPDLVLATRAINRLATVEALEHLGVAVYVTDPRTVEQVLSSTERLGRVLGAGEQAAAVIASLHARLEQLSERLSGSEPRSVFFITWVDPLVSVGAQHFPRRRPPTGGRPLRRSQRRRIGRTSIWSRCVHQQPEYLIFSSDDPEQVRRQVAELRDRPGWQGLEALRQNRIIILSEAFSRPAPRLIDTIEQLARALHPDRFASEHPITPASATRFFPIFSAALRAGAL